MKYALPSTITIAGLVAGIVGVILGVAEGWPLLGLSLALDGIDGPIARRFGAVSEFGAALDWHTDVALAHALAWRSLPTLSAACVSCVLVAWQATAKDRHISSSGRLATWIAIIAWTLTGPP